MLSGSLDAFALSDVFSLLAMTRKTGTLRIRTGRAEGWLEFRDGEVAYAVSDTRRMALASRLLGGGLVDDGQLRHIVAAQRGGAAALSQALLQSDVVDEQAFDALFREQIQDAVFELMRQPEGDFDFDPALPGAEYDGQARTVHLTVGTDQLVEEGQRRLREWDDILTHVVSFDAVVTLAPRPPTEAVTVSMEADQWRLLTFVDGRRTVRDLVDLIGQGEYGTCQMIASLSSSGLVEVVDPTDGGRTRVAELVARHDLLRRLEERELGSGGQRQRQLGDGESRRAYAESPPEREVQPEALPEPVADDERPPAALPVVADELEVDEPAPYLPDAPLHAEPILEQFDEPERSWEPLVAEPDEILEAEEPVSSALDADVEFSGSTAMAVQQQPMVVYPGQRDDDDAFDREEVERELASLGFRRQVPQPDAEPEPSTGPLRINRPDDVNRGLLHRLIDVRKQP